MPKTLSDPERRLRAARGGNGYRAGRYTGGLGTANVFAKRGPASFNRAEQEREALFGSRAKSLAELTLGSTRDGE